MALTLMFFEAHSLASAFVMPATPCLAAVYAGIVQPPWKLDSEAMLTIFPPPCFDHDAPGLLAQLEDSGQHQAQDRVPLLNREIQRALAVLNPRAVHQDVQPPETLYDFRDHLRPLRAVGEVRLDVEQFRAGGGRFFLESVRVRMARRGGQLSPARAPAPAPSPGRARAVRRSPTPPCPRYRTSRAARIVPHSFASSDLVDIHRHRS